MWVGLDGDEIVAAHLPEHRKVRNIRNDSRVALSLETDNVNPIGLAEYVVIYGTARITEGGAPELLQRLAHTYLGPDVRFPPMPDPPPGYITHIAVDRIAVWPVGFVGLTPSPPRPPDAAMARAPARERSPPAAASSRPCAAPRARPDGWIGETRA